MTWGKITKGSVVREINLVSILTKDQNWHVKSVLAEYQSISYSFQVLGA